MYFHPPSKFKIYNMTGSQNFLTRPASTSLFPKSIWYSTIKWFTGKGIIGDLPLDDFRSTLRRQCLIGSKLLLLGNLTCRYWTLRLQKTEKLRSILTVIFAYDPHLAKHETKSLPTWNSRISITQLHTSTLHSLY